MCDIGELKNFGIIGRGLKEVALFQYVIGAFNCTQLIWAVSLITSTTTG
jgi:hypothetical protein